MKEVFEVMRKHKLYAKMAKCEFEKQELEFLGHVVGAGGIKVDPKKVETVRNWPTPKEVERNKKGN